MALLIAVSLAVFMSLDRGRGPSPATVEPTPAKIDSLVAVLKAMSGSVLELTLELSVDVPKGSESDKPDHQEISAKGIVDFTTGDADLVYDYQGLANAAGLLGHFDTMDILYVEGQGFVEAFVSGPPWLSITPQDAASSDVQRLREVMLTTPMLLPGLLEATEADVNDLSAKVDPASLSRSQADLTAGIGEALQMLGGSIVQVDLGPGGSVEISFDYKSAAGRVDVRASYGFVPTNEDVSVDTPDAGSVRPFSTTVG